MFQSNSRYAGLGTAQFTRPDGTVISYAKRRFLPAVGSGALLAEVTVVQGDRPDLLASRVLGDPEQFWRICDANRVMQPADLTAQPGRRLRIEMPQAQV